MKISLYTRISDLIPTKESIFHQIDDLLIEDPKREIFKKYSLDSIFPPLKKAGIEGLELIIPPHLSEQNVKTVNQIVKKYDLKIFSIHQSHDTYLNIKLKEIERLCGIAKTFSAHVIVLHINALKNILSEPTLLTKFKDLQRQYGVTFAIENVVKTPLSMAKEMYQGNEFNQIIEASDLNITFDITHLGQTGENICKFYAKNKDRIVNIHISDYRKNWLNRFLYLANGTHLPLGQGELPIKEFLTLLKKESYQGVITMEINGDLDTLCQNAKLIKSYSF
jgi:sugar phosphate isomerase/epimerase